MYFSTFLRGGGVALRRGKVLQRDSASLAANKNRCHHHVGAIAPGQGFPPKRTTIPPGASPFLSPGLGSSPDGTVYLPVTSPFFNARIIRKRSSLAPRVLPGSQADFRNGFSVPRTDRSALRNFVASRYVPCRIVKPHPPLALFCILKLERIYNSSGLGRDSNSR